MKRILLFSLLALLPAVSCAPDSVVPYAGDGTGTGGVSIAFLKSLYTGAPTPIEGEYIIEGTVVSSDRQGNFYRTLVLWDGTAGIEVRLDVDEIFRLFRLHSRVSVRCNGLWVGSYGGTLQLGAAPFEEYETRGLDPAAIAGHVQSRSEFYEVVVPRLLDFGELAPRHISTYVRFEGVRFADDERGLCWAETGEDAPSATDRHIVDGAGHTLAVRTSRHAHFATHLLPSGEGYIEGVPGYFNGEYQLVLRGESGVRME
jgi:hypothetical protein